MFSSTAYAPFGEQYATAGTADSSFTGQDQDTVSSLYDFQARRQSPSQGRWISPDPAGRKAASLASPQSWNRYAYVQNNPLAIIDPKGLDGDDCEDMPGGGDCPPTDGGDNGSTTDTGDTDGGDTGDTGDDPNTGEPYETGMTLSATGVAFQTVYTVVDVTDSVQPLEPYVVLTCDPTDPSCGGISDNNDPSASCPAGGGSSGGFDSDNLPDARFSIFRAMGQQAQGQQQGGSSQKPSSNGGQQNSCSSSNNGQSTVPKPNQKTCNSIQSNYTQSMNEINAGAWMQGWGSIISCALTRTSKGCFGALLGGTGNLTENQQLKAVTQASSAAWAAANCTGTLQSPFNN